MEKLAEVKAMYGDDEDVSSGPTYRNTTVDRGVAIIPIRGMMLYEATAMNRMIAYYYGGTVMQDVANDFELAMKDDVVKSVLFQVNSGGGQAMGLDAFAERIASMRDVKPIVSHVDGADGSAAYYITAATGKIYATKDSIIGSIGTYVSLENWDGVYEKMGIVETNVLSSCSPNKLPDETTPEGLALWQEMVDAFGWNFVDSVAQNRDTTRKDVVANYGKGWVKIGSEALASGMIDGLASFDTVFNALARGEELPNQKAASKEKKVMGNTAINQFRALLGMEPIAEDEATPVTPVAVVPAAALPSADVAAKDAEIAALKAQLAEKANADAQSANDAAIAARTSKVDAFMASVKGKVPTDNEAELRASFESVVDNEVAANHFAAVFASMPENAFLQRAESTPAPKPSEANKANEVDEAGYEEALANTPMGQRALAVKQKIAA